ncbi:MAG TPA: response regulator [Steroidobacteraceae bacterium]|nr:response regulator [Steroidobacteraceae bacterium]
MARILLVEDNPTNLELMRYLLTHHGHEVTSASNGEEGVRRTRELSPDIVLCDLRMPYLDGYGLLQRVRADSALDDVVVIAVTAYSMPDDRKRVREAGFDGHLIKPIEPERVVGQIEAFIAEGRRSV